LKIDNSREILEVSRVDNQKIKKCIKLKIGGHKTKSSVFFLEAGLAED